MINKRCTKCSDTFNIEEFSIKGKYKSGEIKYQSWCKSCTKKYKDIHYNVNKKYYIEKSSRYRDDFIKWFIDIKKTLECKFCGEDRYWVLDFHHTDSKEKEYNISHLMRTTNKKKLLEEVDKCIVLCSNCHRDLHHKEKNTTRYG